MSLTAVVISSPVAGRKRIGTESVARGSRPASLKAHTLGRRLMLVRTGRTICVAALDALPEPPAVPGRALVASQAMRSAATLLAPGTRVAGRRGQGRFTAMSVELAPLDVCRRGRFDHPFRRNLGRRGNDGHEQPGVCHGINADSSCGSSSAASKLVSAAPAAIESGARQVTRPDRNHHTESCFVPLPHVVRWSGCAPNAPAHRCAAARSQRQKQCLVDQAGHQHHGRRRLTCLKSVRRGRSDRLAVERELRHDVHPGPADPSPKPNHPEQFTASTAGVEEPRASGRLRPPGDEPAHRPWRCTPRDQDQVTRYAVPAKV